MTQLSPKEKAKELYDKYDKITISGNDLKTGCKICVEEIMKAEEALWLFYKQDDFGLKDYNETRFYTYNQEVLKELDKL